MGSIGGDGVAAGSSSAGATAAAPLPDSPLRRVLREHFRKYQGLLAAAKPVVAAAAKEEAPKC